MNTLNKTGISKSKEIKSLKNEISGLEKSIVKYQGVIDTSDYASDLRKAKETLKTAESLVVDYETIFP